MKASIALLLLLVSSAARAEEDGEEFLALMNRPAARDVALTYIGDVQARLDGGLFCLAKGNPNAPADSRAAAFAAVKAWLETHPEERYRPRRYLITQGLRTAFPCAAR